MRLQRNCRKQAIAVRREKAMVHSGKKTRPEAGSPHPMAIGAVVGAQCLTLGACDGSGKNKGSAADTTIAFATIRNLQPVREEVQCRIYIRQPPVKVARP